MVILKPFNARKLKKEVAILFARKDSIYKGLPGCDVYDIERDALTFPGGLPIVAHPPCRAWGRLRHFAKPRPGEKELALWAVDQIRTWGGVLEHPATSTLWKEKNLPLGADRDEWGGFTLSVDQFWWGHKARKRSWFYVVGISPTEVPPIPLRFDAVTHVVNLFSKVRKQKGRYYRPEITKAEREHTPPELARWLIELAKKSRLTEAVKAS